MSYDFFAENNRPDIRNWDQYTILKCTRREDDKNYKKSIQKYYRTKEIIPNWRYINWFVPSSDLVPNSINIKIVFKLENNYFSKDDDVYWPKDNPICKDKVLKIPLMRASSWKGVLKGIIYQKYLDELKNDSKNFDWKRDRIRLFKLFGDEKDNLSSLLNYLIAEKLNKKYEEIKEEFESFIDKNHRKGRLYFYPTFFDNIDLDTIAPHSRSKRKVTTPINFEVVPKGTEGTFYLCYFPFDLIEKENIDKEINEDLNFLKDSIIDMFTKYGFGAKTTSGYGTAKIFNIKINGKDYGNDFNKAFEGMKK